MLGIIIGLNFCLGIAVILYNYRNLPKAVCYGILIICIPVCGILFLAGYRIFKRFFDEQEYVEDKPSKGRQLFSDYRTSPADVVALNDILALEKFSGKRQILTNAIKENSLQNQHILKQAVSDDDREVSHYAATMLTDRIAKLERRLNENQRQQEKTPELEKLFDYADTINKYLELGYLDEKSRQQKENEYADLLERILAVWQQDKKYFAARIRLDIKRNEIKSAEKYCELYQEYFPKNEDVYLLKAELYHKLKNKAKLQQAIEELKACPINLSAGGLKLIRFWSDK